MSRFRDLGEMNVVSFSFLQAFSHDGGEKSLHRAVVQDFRRLLLLQLQVYLDAVALVGALIAISTGIEDMSKLGVPVDVGRRLLECYDSPSIE